MASRSFLSLRAITPRATKQPIKSKIESQTKIPAKYLISIMDNKAIPKAIKAT